MEALLGAYREHILSPLLLVRDELFNTFRTRRSIVSLSEWESDRESLGRMLHDFQSENASHVRPTFVSPTPRWLFFLSALLTLHAGVS